jgi:anaerobic magnesium-protoporphyrin IX monomethyl ester cyclase
MAKLVFIQSEMFAKPGIMALSARVKQAGHRCGLVVADLEKNPVKAVFDQQPDVIGFSITTREYRFMKETAERIRPHFSGKIICGGAHPTFYPGVLKDDCLDAVCRGEGDDALVDYLNAVDRGEPGFNIENMQVKHGGTIHENPLRSLITDLDRLPFYDRSLYTRYRLYRTKGYDLLYHRVVNTGRGCPQACSFCFNKRYNELYKGKGPVVRRRSVSHVIEEVQHLARTDKVRFITFDDDTFTLAPRRWFDEFCTRYPNEVGLPFKINATPASLPEYRVKALKQAGCHAVKMGLESGNQELRNRLLNKPVSNDLFVQTARQLKKEGILVQTFNMMGLPGESLDKAMETYTVNRAIRPDFAWCSLFNPYPGTALYDHCVTSGLIHGPETVSSRSGSYFTGSTLSVSEPVKRLKNILFAALALRLPASWVRWLVTLPLNRFYEFLFGAGMFWGLTRISRFPFFRTMILSLVHLSRYNHEPKA